MDVAAPIEEPVIQRHDLVEDPAVDIVADNEGIAIDAFQTHNKFH